MSEKQNDEKRRKEEKEETDIDFGGVKEAPLLVRKRAVEEWPYLQAL